MKRNLAEQINLARAAKRPAVTTDYAGLLKTFLGGTPRPTQNRFINSDAPMRAYKGMAGVAKTSTLCAAIGMRAILEPGFKGAVARFDYNKLIGTTAQRMEESFNRISPGLIVARDKSAPMEWKIHCPSGGINTLQFIGLKEYLGSYEWHAVAVDEADECDERTVLGLRTRLRAPLGPTMNSLTAYSLMLAFNPPDKTHWLYPACTGQDHEGRKTPDKKVFELFEPVIGENDVNLPRDYFTKNFLGMPEDMVARLRDGEWGSSFPGMPVYPQFSSRLHVVDSIPYDPYRPLIRWWDFGYRHPSCHWVQLDEEYRLKILDEYLGENEEAAPFIDKVVARTNERCPDAPGVLDFGDPAAKQKKDTGSTLSILNDKGIDLMFVQSTIEEGIRRVRFLLERVVKGVPAITISRERCPFTIQMFRGGYHMDDRGVRPVKDGFYDHLADDFRYGVVNMFNEHGRPHALPDWEYNALAESDNLHGTKVPDSLEYTGE